VGLGFWVAERSRVSGFRDFLVAERSRVSAFRGFLIREGRGVERGRWARREIRVLGFES